MFPHVRYIYHNSVTTSFIFYVILEPRQWKYFVIANECVKGNKSELTKHCCHKWKLNSTKILLWHITILMNVLDIQDTTRVKQSSRSIAESIFIYELDEFKNETKRFWVFLYLFVSSVTHEIMVSVIILKIQLKTNHFVELIFRIYT